MASHANTLLAEMAQENIPPKFWATAPARLRRPLEGDEWAVVRQRCSAVRPRLLCLPTLPMLTFYSIDAHSYTSPDLLSR
mmetsp:Transcript_69154/g.162702  ORF Transcript_69154/g.162702 Transcript_69154/m.162702 type:complete len:80 (-) Transcript_69154:298-537(-)